MGNPKFVIFKGVDSQFYFHLKAGNGEKILKSEGYTFKSGAENGIDSVKKNAPYDSQYDRKESLNGQYYFNLIAKNGQVVGTSETYTTKQAMENGIDSVKTNAPNAPIE